MNVLRILLADDRDEDVFLLTEAFRMVGVTPIVTRVSNGRAVVDLTTPPPIPMPWDILVLDYFLPVMDGQMVLERLNESDILSKLPCALLSSIIRSVDRERFLRMGVKRIVEKPNDLEGLCALARELAALPDENSA